MSEASALTYVSVYQTPEHLKRPRPSVPRTAPVVLSLSDRETSPYHSGNGHLFSQQRPKISRAALLKTTASLFDVDYILSQERQEEEEEETSEGSEEETEEDSEASSTEGTSSDNMPKKRQKMRKSSTPKVVEEVVIHDSDSEDESDGEVTRLKAEWSDYDEEDSTAFLGVPVLKDEEDADEKDEGDAYAELAATMKELNEESEEEFLKKTEECAERLAKSMERVSLATKIEVAPSPVHISHAERIRRWKVHPLRESQMNIVNTALRKRPGTHPDDVLSKLGMDRISLGEVQCLKPGTWLKDPVIAFYAALINDRDRLWQASRTEASSDSADRLPHCHMFNSFFYTKVSGSPYERVRTWTRKINVFEFDKILIPVNVSNSHWCLSVINFRDKQFEYYDSMQGCGNANEAINCLRGWLVNEWRDKKPPGVPCPDLTSWTNVPCPHIPQQRNGYDCGVFACTFAEYLSRDAEFSFSQQDMSNIRALILYEIITGRLLSEIE